MTPATYPGELLWALREPAPELKTDWGRAGFFLHQRVVYVVNPGVRLQRRFEQCDRRTFADHAHILVDLGFALDRARGVWVRVKFVKYRAWYAEQQKPKPQIHSMPEDR